MRPGSVLEPGFFREDFYLMLLFTLNTANDFRARLRFPRVAREPPDMNETVKILTPLIWFGF
jgi:hypothetical protein